ncbi:MULTISPECIES: TetR/AcrR family transcriptional regulator [Gordonia]|uniref:TetR/AcrR family transcriptional regulator n=1 Tax=Gordonia amicalis TaxID=89053 RepID=A0AAE4U7H1_9ACTN|nr:MULTISPECIES: TetR/AcrR family transcriptional regulator [Gordonia]ATD70538.1 TetR/AcrR family transcriptional regulator [Gordonia sp. 1D]MCR8895690.1 TetR/AcrR family transcriptional regulator [Gordonia sp. GONU]MCZ4577529.1 TetR/AcrR family transcriptional regulator [Gordonia amicalis]MCZ4651158.1 TetR/AcrR family transcriptional regulator [Gordonia amicalis]MDJ0451477.1 TetR/AcrR family transcriptional regulator [Gordonia amicalis]
MSSPPLDPDSGPGPAGGRSSPRGPRAEQIIRAATALFQDAGYRNVSIEQIGAAVGLTGPAVYRHFPGKHDILVQALLTQVDLMDELVREADEYAGTPEAQLWRFLDRLGDLTANQDVSILWRREQRHLRPTQLEQMRSYFTRFSDYIADKVAAARPDLSFDDGRLLGFAVLSLYSNTSVIRGTMAPVHVMQIQRAVAHSIINCSLPETKPDATPAIPVTRRPAGRHERILDAATDLFAERGFHDVRIDDIARAADISVATFYQQVPGKTEILRAVLVRGVEGMLYLTTHALTGVDPGDALDVLISIHVEQALGVHGRTIPVWTRDIVYLPEADQDALRSAQRAYIAEWVAAIRARTPELSEADAAALTRAFIGVADDIVQAPDLRARPGITDDLATLSKTILQPVGLLSNG